MFLILETILGAWAAWKLIHLIWAILIASVLGFVTYKALQVLGESPAQKAYWIGVIVAVVYLFGHSLIAIVFDL